MKSIQRSFLFLAKLTLVTLAAVVVMGFAVQPSAYASCPHIDCTGSIDFPHIRDGHCASSGATCPPKSIIDPTYCITDTKLRQLCSDIKTDPNAVENQQPNGRYKCVATFANTVVGTDRSNNCNETKTGTVIYGEGSAFPGQNYVVTEFPGS